MVAGGADFQSYHHGKHYKAGGSFGTDTFKNYSDGDSVVKDDFKRYGRDGNGRSQVFANYAPQTNVEDQGFATYANGASADIGDFSNYGSNTLVISPTMDLIPIFLIIILKTMALTTTQAFRISIATQKTPITFFFNSKYLLKLAKCQMKLFIKITIKKPLFLYLNKSNVN